jgi:hypothetical protein
VDLEFEMYYPWAAMAFLDSLRRWLEKPKRESLADEIRKGVREDRRHLAKVTRLAASGKSPSEYSLLPSSCEVCHCKLYTASVLQVEYWEVLKIEIESAVEPISRLESRLGLSGSDPRRSDITSKLNGACSYKCSTCGAWFCNECGEPLHGHCPSCQGSSVDYRGPRMGT